MLRKDERIRTAGEIKGILKRKQILLNSPTLQIIAEQTQRTNCRILVICPNKVANAVERNRMRRKIITLIREISCDKAKKHDYIIKVLKNDRNEIIGRDISAVIGSLI